MHIVSCPLSVMRGVRKPKPWRFNLNEYRNANYLLLNEVKQSFKIMVEDQVLVLPRFNTAQFEYLLYPGSHHEIDVANICCVIDKFFSDAIVELGRLPADSYWYLNKVTYAFAEVDKRNPRVDVKITGQLWTPPT